MSRKVEPAKESVYIDVIPLEDQIKQNEKQDNIENNTDETKIVTENKLSRKTKYKKDVATFFLNSTLHGMKNCFLSNTAIQRAIWVILLVGLLAVFSVTGFDMVFHKYLRFPVRNVVSIVQEDKSVFPSVTICNFNMFNHGRAGGTVFHDMVELLHEKFGYIHDNHTYPEGIEEHRKILMASNIHNITLREVYRTIGHRLEDMLYTCTFNGKDCGPSNFTETFTSMGLCYTFNSGEEGFPLLKTDSTGKRYGLTLFLNVEQNEYVGIKMLESAGIKVLLHNQGEPPDIENVGFGVAPGTQTFVSTVKSKTQNLEMPYENGCEKHEVPGYSKYTKAACMLDCHYAYLLMKCGCWYYGKQEENVRECSAKDLFACIQPLVDSNEGHNASLCHCPEPCESTKYLISLSYGQYPSEQSMKYLTHSMSAFHNISKMKETLTSNYVVVEIYYQDLSYQLSEAVAAYTLSDLLGDIGGQLGLFLGASLITIYEIFDFLIDIVLIRIGKR